MSEVALVEEGREEVFNLKETVPRHQTQRVGGLYIERRARPGEEHFSGHMCIAFSLVF